MFTRMGEVYYLPFWKCYVHIASWGFHLILLSAFFFCLFMCSSKEENINGVNAFVPDWTQTFPFSYMYFLQNRCLTCLPKSASFRGWIGPFHLESISVDLEKLGSFLSTLERCVRSSAVFCRAWRYRKSDVYIVKESDINGPLIA